MQRQPPNPRDGIRFLDEPPAPPTPPPAPPKPGPPAPAPARRRERPIALLTFLAVVAVGVVAKLSGVAFPARFAVDEEVARSFAVGAAPRVTVETYNGKVEVTRGESGTVDCLVTKRGTGIGEEAAAADLKNIVVHMIQDGDAVSVVARRAPGAASWSSGATVRVRVPEDATVQLKTSNGPIDVAGIGGSVAARSSNGKIAVREATGVVSLETSNGAISCEATDAVLDAVTSNGSIDFRGSLAPGRATLRTSNGSVTLRLPGDQAFHLDAKTSNGKVTSDFAVIGDGDSPSKVLVGDFGDRPEVDIKVHTSNGSVRVLEDEE